MHTQPIHQHSLTPCSLSLSDNAWMETVAMHFHVAPKKAEALPLKAGDDAAEVRWLAISDDIEGMRCQKHSTDTATLCRSVLKDLPAFASLSLSLVYRLSEPVRVPQGHRR